MRVSYDFFCQKGYSTSSFPQNLHKQYGHTVSTHRPAYIWILQTMLFILFSALMHAQVLQQNLPAPNGGVYAMALDTSSNIIYIGGSFTTVGGLPRNGLAAIDVMTGTVTGWNPGANDVVHSLFLLDSTLYVGGRFITIGGQGRTHFAGVNKTTGQVTAMNIYVGYDVTAIAASGTTVYAGGEFYENNYLRRLAAIDAATGNLLSWDPAPNGSIMALSISGSLLYAGGGFSSIGGKFGQYNLAALDATTGAASNWNPRFGNDVRAVAISGSTVYVGGMFQSVGQGVGTPRNYISAIENPGFLTNWNPNANGYVNALAVTGSTVYAGGHFNFIGGQSRVGIAAINASTGLSTNWNPNPNGPVFVIVSSPKYKRIFFGGEFTTVLGESTGCFAGVSDPETFGFSVSFNSSNQQTGMLNTVLGQPFEVQTKESEGVLFPGGNVTFAITGTPYNAVGQSLSTTNANSNANSVASSTLTIGNKYGNYQVTATAKTPIGNPVIFNAYVFDQSAGKALKFDGLNDVVNVPASSSVNLTQGTWEAWVNVNTLSHHNRILYKEGADHYGKYELYILDNSSGSTFNADVVVNGSRYTATAAGIVATTGEWFHVAATYDSNNLKIYVNGILRGSTAIIGGGSIDVNTGPLGIGGNISEVPSALFEGTVDEVRIWNTVQTETEIRSNLNHSFTSLPSGLTAYWQFSEGSGSTNAQDIVNGVNGVLTNMNVSSAWVSSTIPFGAGTTTKVSSFTNGSASLGSVVFTTTDNFDAASEISSREFLISPNVLPPGSALSGTYWSIQSIGDAGIFAGRLTFTVPSSFTNNNQKFLSQYKLYRRNFGGEGSWTLAVAKAATATSTSVAFDGITQFGQFALATTSIAALDSTPKFGLRFDGINDVVTVPAYSTINLTKGTWEAWVKINTLTHKHRILFKEGADHSGKYGLYISDNTSGNTFNADVVVNGLRYTVTAASNTAESGKWYHLAASYDLSTVKIFVNGILCGSTTIAGGGSIDENSGPMGIGGNITETAGELLEGSIDEVRIWNIVLDSTTIRQNMHRLFNSITPGLMSQWQFVEGSGTTAIDAVGGNDGTLNNFNFNSSSGWVESTIPAGKGISTTISSFTDGTANLGTVTVTTTNDFDNSVELVGTQISNAPNILPVGFTEILNNRYWVINSFGSGGDWSTNVTFTVTSSFTSNGTVPESAFRLYRRNSNSDTSWSLVVYGASSTTPTTVTFNGITQFGQFILVKNLVIGDKTPRFALRFDGIDDNVEVFAGTPTAYTIEMWVKPNSISDQGLFVRTNAGGETGAFSHEINIHNGRFEHYAFDGNSHSVNGVTQVIPGKWYYVVATAENNGQMRLFVNGIQEGTPLSVGTLWTGGDRYKMGVSHVGFLNGTLDEVRLWNSALDSVLIRQNMHRMFSTTNGLISQWQFIEGSGTVAVDSMGGKNGTLNNFNFTSSSGWVASTIPAGNGTEATTVNFTAGTASLGGITVTVKEDFDHPVQLTGITINNAPSILPAGSSVLLNDRYWIINAFGNGGSFSTNLTVTVPPEFNTSFSTFKLFSRESTSDTAWSPVVSNVVGKTSTTITFGGITSFGQFILARDSVTSLDGISGYALQCNGIDSYVEIANSDFLQFDEGTIEAWIKVPVSGAGSGYRGIFTKPYQYGLFLKDNQLIGYDWTKASAYGADEYGDIYSGVMLNDDQWHHVAMVIIGGRNRAIMIYVDGNETNLYSLDGDVVYDLSGHDAGYNLRIANGIVYNGSGGVLTGNIEEVRIWKTIRTAAQIRESMHRTLFVDQTDLVADWQFNQGSGTSAVEMVNCLNGTLVNAPVWSVSTAPIGNGTASSALSITSGTAHLGALSLTVSEPFDNSVDLTATALDVAPNVTPGGYSSVIGGKYFIINTFGDPGVFSVNLTIHFVPGTLDSRVDINPGGVKLYKRNATGDGAWTEVGGATNANAASGDITWTGITSFGQFAAVYEVSALPVELVSFTASSKLLNAELQWKTATEVNNYGFEVERSAIDNGTLTTGNWSKAGFIEGSGNSNTAHEYTFTDHVTSAGKYSYRLKQIDRDGKFSYSPEVEITFVSVPKVFALEQNYPNPFNPSTTIRYGLASSSRVSLKVYNILGQQIAELVNTEQSAGWYETVWNANVSSGLYFYRIEAVNTSDPQNRFTRLKKMVLLK